MSIENPLEHLGLVRIKMEEDDRYSWVYYAGAVENVIKNLQDENKKLKAQLAIKEMTKCHFIKIGKKLINLDNVAIIEPKKDLGYVVNFAGQTHIRDISEADMVDIRREIEKIKSPCDNCDHRKFNQDGTWECIGTHVCMGKLNLDG